MEKGQGRSPPALRSVMDSLPDYSKSPLMSAVMNSLQRTSEGSFAPTCVHALLWQQEHGLSFSLPISFSHGENLNPKSIWQRIWEAWSQDLLCKHSGQCRSIAGSCSADDRCSSQHLGLKSSSCYWPHSKNVTWWCSVSAVATSALPPPACMTLGESHKIPKPYFLSIRSGYCYLSHCVVGIFMST